MHYLSTPYNLSSWNIVVNYPSKPIVQRRPDTTNKQSGMASRSVKLIRCFLLRVRKLMWPGILLKLKFSTFKACLHRLYTIKARLLLSYFLHFLSPPSGHIYTSIAELLQVTETNKHDSFLCFIFFFFLSLFTLTLLQTPKSCSGNSQ
jgi:hypothetical protein